MHEVQMQEALDLIGINLPIEETSWLNGNDLICIIEIFWSATCQSVLQSGRKQHEINQMYMQSERNNKHSI